MSEANTIHNYLCSQCFRFVLHAEDEYIDVVIGGVPGILKQKMLFLFSLMAIFGNILGTVIPGHAVQASMVVTSGMDLP